MALLQITEPGMSTEPHKHRLAVGIDLGTTNSLVATVRNGIAICLPDETGRTMLPSAVRYQSDGSIDVGLGGTRRGLQGRREFLEIERSVPLLRVPAIVDDGAGHVHFPGHDDPPDHAHLNVDATGQEVIAVGHSAPRDAR